MTEYILDKIWAKKLNAETHKDYFKDLVEFIKKERSQYIIYPKEQDVFAALNLTHFDNVKVVIIGQDPYHSPNQAHGLSFSVKDGIKPPPSLVNIFKELKTDLGFQIPKSGNLTSWAKQGVLLLNATLTVREGLPGSHQKKGWETFTDSIIKTLSDDKEKCVFLLWGNYAKTKKLLIDLDKHLVLESAHPSPLARGGFFGCKHFSKTNSFLQLNNIEPINWNLNHLDLFTENNY